MTHPCASAKPPAWCNRKRKRKKAKRGTSGLSAVSPAQVRAHLKANKVKIVSKKVCTVQSGARKGRLKKGCFYGRGGLKGKILKKTR